MKTVIRTIKQFNKLRFLQHYLIGHKGFIAGGCFKNIIQGKKIKDVDIFFRNMEDYNEAESYFSTNEDYVFSYENHKVKSYKNTKTNIRIELIFSVFGSPEEVISNFDFTITKFSLYSFEEDQETMFNVVFVDTFFEDLSTNKLVIDDKLLFPVSTFERSYRYRDYGFGLCKESKSKLLETLKTANTDDLSNDLYFGID